MIRFGIFWHGTEPCIFLRDLDLIKKVQVTDSDHFTDFGNELKRLGMFISYILILRFPARQLSEERDQQLRAGRHERRRVEEDQENGHAVLQCSETQEDAPGTERLCSEGDVSDYFHFLKMISSAC